MGKGIEHTVPYDPRSADGPGRQPHGAPMIQSLLTSTGVDHKGSPAGKGVDHTMRLLSKGAPMGKGVDHTVRL